MFAVVRTGGKQYRIAAEDKITVDRLTGEVGDTILLEDVLAMGEGSSLQDVKDQVVTAEIVAQTKGDKIIIFKKKRRQGYRRRNGHRQLLTILKITAIGKGAKGAKPAAKAAAPAKADAKPAAEAAPKAEAKPAKAEAKAAAKPKADAKTEAKAPAKAAPAKKAPAKAPAKTAAKAAAPKKPAK